MMVYLFALLLGIVAWVFIKYLSKSEGFLSKSKLEQQRIKKRALWGVYGGLALGCLLAWLMLNGLTSWVPYLLIIIYLLIWVGGGYLLWLAYIFGVRRDTTRIQTSDGVQFREPQKYLVKFAVINLMCGFAFLFIAIAIPILKIDLKSWGAMIFLVLVCRNLVHARFEKSNSEVNS